MPFYIVGALKPNGEKNLDFSVTVEATTQGEALFIAYSKGLPRDPNVGHWVDEFEGSCLVR